MSSSPRVEILHSDCLSAMLFMEDNSVDSIVTDPPYGLAFMGKKWDYDVPSVEVWAECLRVLKPGGHLLSFGGSRTYHRMVVAVEDAGFEIRDQIMWIYGSGFPKSHNGAWGGTALKPSHEPIVMARKPLIGTVEANWQAHGTGALNIDVCRVATDPSTDDPRLGGAGAWKTDKAAQNVYEGGYAGKDVASSSLGRWPANLIHDGSAEVLTAFPQAPGQQADVSHTAPSDKTSNVYGAMKRVGEPSQDSDNEGSVGFKMKPGARRLDAGSAARFFYCAKAGKKDRNEGLVDPGAQFTHGTTLRAVENTDTKGNNHPTVKPTDLMAYLVRLVTPVGGLVFDPFMGSGSTGKAAVREGLRFVGCDMQADYVTIARARIEHEVAQTGGAA